MEIDRLYTSIDFGLHLRGLTTYEFCAISGAELPRLRTNWTAYQNALEFLKLDAYKLNLRDDWDKFLKQPIKINMVFNELEHPNTYIFQDDYKTYSDWESEYTSILRQWEDLEKKVILNGFEPNQPDRIKRNGILIISYGKWQLSFFPKSHEIYLDNLETHRTKSILTLHDLAEATYSELTINNVKI